MFHYSNISRRQDFLFILSILCVCFVCFVCSFLSVYVGDGINK